MGKKMIPPNDPARLAMVMDDKRRIYGVGILCLNMFGYIPIYQSRQWRGCM